MDRTAPQENFGTARLLLRAPDEHGKPLVLLQRRAATDDDRGGWALPETVPNRNETPVGTALRLAESVGADRRRVRMRRERVDRDGGAAPVSSTLVTDVRRAFAVLSEDTAWVPEPEIGALDLDPAFAARRAALQAPESGLLVDAANVVGSRPDGWWRDRVGAAELLLRNLAAAAPGVLAVPEDGFRWISRPVVVLEGAAKQAGDLPGLEVIRAPGSGDDTIVEVAHRGTDWVVVTADRGLRARLPARAHPVGPSTLRSWISPAPG